MSDDVAFLTSQLREKDAEISHLRADKEALKDELIDLLVTLRNIAETAFNEGLDRRRACAANQDCINCERNCWVESAIYRAVKKSVEARRGKVG